MIIFEICAFLCIFAPFTFVFCLVSAIKKAVSGEGNELLGGFLRRAEPAGDAGRPGLSGVTAPD